MEGWGGIHAAESLRSGLPARPSHPAPLIPLYGRFVNDDGKKRRP